MSDKENRHVVIIIINILIMNRNNNAQGTNIDKIIWAINGRSHSLYDVDTPEADHE